MTLKTLDGKSPLNFPLLIALVILALRLSTINSIGASILDPLQDTKTELYSVVMNFLLLVSLAISLVQGAGKKSVKSGAGFISALAFAGLCWLSCVFASEKRYAIDAALMITAAVAFFLLIRQSACRGQTIAVCIMVIMGLCAVNMLESINQLTQSNAYLIEQYESNPAPQLETLGIEPGSLEQFMYEHRLYSKDIKGFFTNGNSLGSFSLLCFFPALSLLISALKSKSCPNAGKLIALLSVAMCVAMLGLSSSKGTLGGLAAGLFVYFALTALKDNKKRNLLLGGFAISAVLALSAMLVCAAKFASLPGGNSMLVRGEYWHSTIKMISSNLLGAGGDNFRFLYTAFKLPSAMETVIDPHCFILSIAAQYGLPALAAFAAIVYVAMRHNKDEISTISEPAKPALLIPALAALIMLIARPILLPVLQADSASVQTYIFITMYLMPAVVFFGWSLFTGNRLLSHVSLCGMPLAIRASLAAFLTHNLIDLSIFEPGNMLMFFAMLGMLELCREPKAVAGKAAARKIALGSVGVCAAAFIFAVLPCGRLSAAVDKIPNGGYGIFDKLTQSDEFSSTAASLAARICVQMQLTGIDRPILLEKAEQLYTLEASRNPKSFKPYSSLGRLCEIKNEYAKAAQYYQQAIERYPGKASLYVSVGRCLGAVGRKDLAVAYCRRAIEIEAEFEEKFREMYPGVEPVSRLNKEYLRSVDEALKP